MKWPRSWKIEHIFVAVIIAGGLAAAVIFSIGTVFENRTYPVPLEPVLTPINCGADWDCLIDAAVECDPAEATVRSGLETHHVIVGLDSADCISRHEIVVSSGTDTPAPAVGECRVSQSELVAVLHGLRTGLLSVESIPPGCTGSYFTLFESAPSGSGTTGGGSGGTGSGGGSGSSGGIGGGSGGTGGGSTDPSDSTGTDPGGSGGTGGSQGSGTEGSGSGGQSGGGGSTPTPACTLSGPSVIEFPPDSSTLVRVEGWSGFSSQVSWASLDPSIASVQPVVGSPVLVTGHTLGATELLVTDTAVGPSCQILIQVRIIASS